MKENKTLISYVLGLLTVLTFIPLIESVTEIICGYLELLKLSYTRKVLKGNKEIQDLQMELEPVSTSCMGFQYDGDEEYFEDGIEDKKKSKIGFHI